MISHSKSHPAATVYVSRTPAGADAVALGAQSVGREREAPGLQLGPTLTHVNLLQLQRTVGNHAVQRLVAQGSVDRATVATQRGTTTGGLAPEVTPDDTDKVVGGDTFGEMVGDIARPVGKALGNAVGWTAGAVTGIDITSSTNSGPTWSPHGHFDWRVGLTTTGRQRVAGWIVQEIVNTIRAEDASGTPLNTRAVTPNYWAA